MIDMQELRDGQEDDEDDLVPNSSPYLTFNSNTILLKYCKDDTRGRWEHCVIVEPLTEKSYSQELFFSVMKKMQTWKKEL